MKTTNSLLLTEKERIELLTIKITKNEIISNFTLSPKEILDIKNIYNSHSQLGYAIQLLYLKNLGRTIPLSAGEIPLEPLQYIGQAPFFSRNRIIEN